MIKNNTDINALSLGRVLQLCGQFVDGRVASMIVVEDGDWKIDAGQSLCFEMASIPT